MSTSSLNIQTLRDSTEGSSGLTWSATQNQWLCADSEGYVYSKSDGIPDFQKTSHAVLAGLSCLVSHPTKDICAVAHDDSVVMLTMPDFELLDGSKEIKLDLQVNHVCFDKNGNHLLVCSGSAGLKVYSTTTWMEEKTLSSADQGLCCSAISDDSKFVAMLDVDGSVLIYSVDVTLDITEGGSKLNSCQLAGTLSSVVSKTVTRASKNESVGCKLSWHPSHPTGLLAVPSLTGSLLLAERDLRTGEWVEHLLLSGDADLNMAEFSPDGKYLLTADATGTVNVWAVDVNSPNKSQHLHTYQSVETEAYLVDIGWSKKTDEYAFLALSQTGAATEVLELTVGSGASSRSVASAFAKAVPDLPAEAEEIAIDDGQDDVNGFMGGTGAQVPLSTQYEMEEANADELAAFEAAAEGAVKAAVAAASSAIPLPPRSPIPSSKTEISTTPSSRTRSATKKSATPVRAYNTFSSAELTKSKSPAPAVVGSVVAKEMKKLTKKRLVEEDDDDDDDLFETTLSPSEAATKAADTAAVEAAQADGNIGALKSKIVPTTNPEDTIADEDRVDDSDDDDHEYQLESHEELLKLTNAALAGARGRGGAAAVGFTDVSTAIELQPSFQPSTTTRDEKKRCYLAWNNVGNITHREDDLESRIEIRFTNSAGGNRNEAFPDREGFSIASLSFEGAVFATSVKPKSLMDIHSAHLLMDAKPDDATPGSTVYYHAFTGHMDGVNASFRIVLTHGENAQCVAVGRGFVAVATSRNLLRIYSSTGLPVDILCLSGPVVSLVGHESKLAVVTHDSPTGNSFNMSCVVYDVNWEVGCQMRVECSATRLPLSRESKLMWTGFDADMHTFIALDSHGMMFSLSRLSASSWRWQPVLDINDAKSSPDHVFWPIMVKQSKLVYVLLNGESRPSVYPQPVVSVLPLKIPIALDDIGVTLGGKKSKQAAEQKDKLQRLVLETSRATHLESLSAELEALVHSKVAILPKDQAEVTQQLETQRNELDKLLLKHLQDACVGGDNARALNVCLSIRGMNTLNMGITVANHFGRQSVASALQSLLEFRQVQEEERLLKEQRIALSTDAYYTEDMDEDLAHGGSQEVSFEQSQSQTQAQQFQQSPPVAPAASTSMSGGLRRKRNGGIADAYDEDDDVIDLESDEMPYEKPQHSENNSSFNSFFSAKPANTKKYSSAQVSPQVTAAGATALISGSPTKPAAVNPFAVKSTGTTPVKRKGTYAGMQDLKTSPSPAKKPLLSRTSTFSQEARRSQHSTKRLL